jgi:hypothetical protein
VSGRARLRAWPRAQCRTNSYNEGARVRSMPLAEIGRAPTWFARFLTREAIGGVGHVFFSADPFPLGAGITQMLRRR